jgi:hypothetical protein
MHFVVLLVNITTHFTDMCIPHFFLASERRSTFGSEKEMRSAHISEMRSNKLLQNGYTMRPIYKKRVVHVIALFVRNSDGDI